MPQLDLTTFQSTFFWFLVLFFGFFYTFTFYFLPNIYSVLRSRFWFSKIVNRLARYIPAVVNRAAKTTDGRMIYVYRYYGSSDLKFGFCAFGPYHNRTKRIRFESVFVEELSRSTTALLKNVANDLSNSIDKVLSEPFIFDSVNSDLNILLNEELTNWFSLEFLYLNNINSDSNQTLLNNNIENEEDI